MKPSDYAQIAQVAFLELVAQDSTFHGRTYSFFEPVANKKMGINIFIADNATGFSVCIPVEKKQIVNLEKGDLQVIMKRVLTTLIETIKKYPQHGKPVDYEVTPCRAGRRQSMLERRVNLDKARVNVYTWSTILIAG